MGMDLDALDPKDDTFARAHVSWTTWELLREFLAGLRFDVSSMADNNDGAIIEEITCESWAEALTREWPNILVFVTEDGEEASLVLATDTKAVDAAVASFGYPGTPISDDGDFGPEIDEARLFFANCGGCRQH